MSRKSTATPGVSLDRVGHRPVLVTPLIESLQPQPGQIYIDGTLGGGGVVEALLAHLLPGGMILAIDRDAEAVQRAQRRFPAAVVARQGNFAVMDQIARQAGIAAVDGVVLDLGISSIQLDDPRRGFSFQTSGPLDMRMDQDSTTTAADLVNTWSAADLTELLRTYGQERFASRVAAAIVEQRARQPLQTTAQLRSVIENAIPRKFWPKRIHPATKTFQALRMEVNDELGALREGLQAAISILRPGGRLGVISFHSLEDSLVKNTLHVAATNCICPPQQPNCTCAHRASLLLLRRSAIKPSAAEIASNPRSRSARLRVAEKI